MVRINLVSAPWPAWTWPLGAGRSWTHHAFARHPCCLDDSCHRRWAQPVQAADRGILFAIDKSPAFYVTCRNETGQSVSSASNIWAWAPNHIRIDGKPHLEPGGIIGPGLSSMIDPGAAWHGIISFRQSATGFSPAVQFGATIRGGRIAPPSPGRHTIAVLCGDQWSDDYEFYWEPEITR